MCAKLPSEHFSAQLKAGSNRNAKKGSARPGPSPALSQNLPGMAFLRPTILEASVASGIEEASCFQYSLEDTCAPQATLSATHNFGPHLEETVTDSICRSRIKFNTLKASSREAVMWVAILGPQAIPLIINHLDIKGSMPQVML